jgi:hypothetical protein
MASSALQRFIEHVRPAWGPLTSALVAHCRHELETLLKASSSEPWLAELHRCAPTNAELYRDPDRGFMLLAHTEQAGLYRAPHDHGRGWVIYAMQRGEIEMRTYGRIEDPDGRWRLVQRDSTVMRAGQVQAYLPGDIHDTRCVSESALLFRFTERDLKYEDKVERRLTRYVEREGVWTPAAL